jgi:hypothetical protein
MKRFIGILYHWLPLAAASIGICGIIYVAVQQQYRQSANDPQVQLTQDMATALVNDKKPEDIVPQDYLFDIEKTLATFTAVYDANYTPLQQTAFFNNAPVKPPVGVFEHAKQWGENRVTWQPNATTRIALVVRYVPSNPEYFVASGRNMREVESRISRLIYMMCIGLITILVITFLLDVFGDVMRRRMMAHEKK